MKRLKVRKRKKKSVPSESLIQQEIDIPFPTDHSEEEMLPHHKVEDMEKMVQLFGTAHSLSLKDRAFTLVIILIVLILAIYGLDVFLQCKGLPNSNLLNGVFEFLKVTLSTLIGVVFSSKLQEK